MRHGRVELRHSLHGHVILLLLQQDALIPVPLVFLLARQLLLDLAGENLDLLHYGLELLLCMAVQF